MDKVGFVSGLVIPSVKQKERALGRDYKELCLSSEYSNKHGAWSDIPTPTHIDDWLAQYEEKPQDYLSWNKLHKKIFASRSSTKIIYLIQITAPGYTIPHFPSLQEYIQHTYYGVPIQVLPPIEVLCTDQNKPLELVATYQASPKHDKLEWDLDTREAHEYDLHRKRKTDRQIRVNPLINILSYILPKDALCLCAVTMEDLYDGNEDSFVSGMAAGRSHVGVFSFARYTVDKLADITIQECKGLKLNLQTVRRTRGARAARIKQTILLRRSCKTLSHEIGHLFGIGHCVYYNCIMNGSGHLVEDFSQSMHFCPVDLRKITHLISPDSFWERYKKLHEFYCAHNWNGDAEWVKQRLENSEAENVIDLESSSETLIDLS